MFDYNSAAALVRANWRDMAALKRMSEAQFFLDGIAMDIYFQQLAEQRKVEAASSLVLLHSGLMR